MYATIIGVGFISLISPLISSLGLSKTTYLILIYSPFLSAVFTALLIDKENAKKKNETTENINGKNVIIRTNESGIVQGVVKNIEKNMIILEDAKRLDLPGYPKAYRIFIDKNDIKSMEIL